MLRYIPFTAFLFLNISCKQSPHRKDQPPVTNKSTVTRLYSQHVADSFSVFINLPEGYNPNRQEKYPVVYLLDANLYFDIMATTINKYSEVGLAPAVILVGIGYKDFPAMDSLRNRDDTYPAAIPEYEMSTSGGADKFLSFINNELTPYIDRSYKTDTSKRVLMGHSLGGYFTVYALLQGLLAQSRAFNGYIAASPSLHYNKYYLLTRLKETPVRKNEKAKVYITYGGLEDEGEPGMIKFNTLNSQLSTILSGNTTYKGDIYSALGHMDTQLPTFIKGLQWTFSEEQ